MTQRVIEMPNLGVGTFRLEGDTAYNSVKMALDVGFRHIDTAQDASVVSINSSK